MFHLLLMFHLLDGYSFSLRFVFKMMGCFFECFCCGESRESDTLILLRQFPFFFTFFCELVVFFDCFPRCLFGLHSLIDCHSAAGTLCISVVSKSVLKRTKASWKKRMYSDSRIAQFLESSSVVIFKATISGV